jgi:enoyl-CoA hydratase/carnithine racemase
VICWPSMRSLNTRNDRDAEAAEIEMKGNVMGQIIAERIGKVMVVTIANETKRNALNVSMEKPFYDCLVDADNDDAIRVVVITGAGDIAFCSGHDLSEIGRPDIQLMKPDPMGHPDLMKKPVIAAVNGHCHAAGLMMALCCDLRIASENAVFGQPAARTGGLPMGGQIWRLSSAMPKVRATEMMFTAEHLSAQDAYDWGLVNKLVPRGRAREAALALAENIAAKSAATVQAIKAGQKIYERQGLEAFNRFQADMYETLNMKPERTEGIAAFAEKRPPLFS